MRWQLIITLMIKMKILIIFVQDVEADYFFGIGSFKLYFEIIDINVGGY
jgi:hypothetical protein